MISPAEFAARVRQAASHPPSNEPVIAAAERAARKTNATFVQARLPLHAVVDRHGQGVRVKLVQSGPLVHRFAGRTPSQVLRDNIQAEMRIAAAQVRDEARKAFLG